MLKIRAQNVPWSPRQPLLALESTPEKAAQGRLWTSTLTEPLQPHLGAALQISSFESGSPSVQAVFGMHGSTSPAVFEADHPCYLLR